MRHPLSPDTLSWLIHPLLAHGSFFLLSLACGRLNGADDATQAAVRAALPRVAQVIF